MSLCLTDAPLDPIFSSFGPISFPLPPILPLQQYNKSWRTHKGLKTLKGDLLPHPQLPVHRHPSSHTHLLN